MNRQYYTVAEAAELCQLHPRTIVRKIKDGSLKAHKIGRQYRLTHRDMEIFMGGTLSREADQVVPASSSRMILVSSVADIESVDKEESQRISNTLMAVLNSESSSSSRVDCLYYEEQKRLKIIINSDPDRTSRILKMLEVFFEQKV